MRVSVHDMKNHERILVRIVREACAAMQPRIAVESLGDGWILRLSRTHENTRRIIGHIHGYCFDLNPAATHQLCCDKAAAAEVLASLDIPCVPHQLVLHPDMSRFVPHHGTWEAILRAWRAWNQDVVVKDNTGTGGRGVYHCRSIVELERAVYSLFARQDSLAISPFVDVKHEYRFVMLDHACELAYEKVRATVTGDGESSTLALATKQAALTGDALSQLLENLTDSERTALASVPARGATHVLNWRHNLGQGATARVLDCARVGSGSGAHLENSAISRALTLAQRAALALNLSFGSVDIIADGKGEYAVLEVNSGVMMEFLAQTLPEGPAIAKDIYTKAIRLMAQRAM